MKKEDKPIFDKLSSFEALGLTIYGEARGESHAGQIAVAYVIINRSLKWRKSIKEICYQKNQFSCFNSNDPQYEKLKLMAINYNVYIGISEKLRKCYDVAFMALSAPFESTVDDALYYQVVYEDYKADGTRIYSPSKWFNDAIKSGKLEKVCTIEHHEFYREKEVV
jgi:hypothetical protein